jgi:hypothetical protein
MIGIILIYGVSYFIFGEIISKGGGFGWDGRSYKVFTQKLYGAIFVTGLDQYYIQRLFVPAFLYIGFKITGISATDINVLWTYRILNLILLLVSVYFYNLIAKELKFKNKVIWLGFCSLIINFAVLKQSFYNPVYLDIPIFTIGIIQFYFYLKNNLTGMIMTAIIGAFTWPTFLYSSLILILLPIKSSSIIYTQKSIKNIILLIVAISFSVSGCYLYIFHLDLLSINGISPINSTLILLSIICLFLFLLLALNPLLKYNKLYDLKSCLGSLRLKNIIIAIIMFSVIYITIHLQKPNELYNTDLFIMRILLLSITMPLIFLISHIIYFGPVLILMMYYWKNIAGIVHSFGLGLTLFVLFYVLLSINSESRNLINAFPVFIILSMLAINNINIKSQHLISFFCLSLLYSKFWFKLNISEFHDDVPGGFQQFPDQTYFMSLGPWMSYDMYLLQGTLVLLTGVLIFYILSRDYKSDKIIPEYNL